MDITDPVVAAAQAAFAVRLKDSADVSETPRTRKLSQTRHQMAVFQVLCEQAEFAGSNGHGCHFLRFCLLICGETWPVGSKKPFPNFGTPQASRYSVPTAIPISREIFFQPKSRARSPAFTR